MEIEDEFLKSKSENVKKKLLELREEINRKQMSNKTNKVIQRTTKSKVAKSKTNT